MQSLAFPIPNPSARRALRRRLLAWYDANARDLPWRRRAGDPYAVWLSEIMLQQTQVATVKDYFERFIQAIPSIDALAKAPEQKVMRLWEGLGYYRRARQLHQAAKVIVAEHAGQFPRDPDAVRALPGIGRYTAGAILSIAFDDRQPILEANTLRLLSRLVGYAGDPRSGEGQRLLWATAEALLPRRGAGRLNQALMELGSGICTPRSPACATCPIAAHCRAFQQGRQQEIPPPKSKPAIEAVREAAVVVRRRGRILLLRWPTGRRWAGLWDFPRFPVHAEHPPALRQEIIDNVRALTGTTVAPGEKIATLTHGVTRFRITLECHQAEYAAASKNGSEPLETQWVKLDELDDLPLSSTGRKLANLISSRAAYRPRGRCRGGP